MIEGTDQPNETDLGGEFCGLRAELCSIEHANRVAERVAEGGKSDTVVVSTGQPLQPFRVLLANCAGSRKVVSRVLTCRDQQDAG